jgi:hypothetical protein
MATIDDFFLAHGISFSGFNTFLTRNGNPSFTVGVAGFGNRNGVYGQTEVIDVPRFIAGVYGTAATQPGVIGFSRDGDGAQGLSFTGTAFRAASFFGPGVHSISGALSGVTGISDTQGPPAGMNIPTIAGVVGTAASRPGVIGTSNALMGVYGFSTGNAGIVGETANPNSFAGFFAGNAVVTGTLTAGVKNAMVAFPDGSQRVLHCMESPEHWFEDFGAAKLKNRARRDRPRRRLRQSDQARPLSRVRHARRRLPRTLYPQPQRCEVRGARARRRQVERRVLLSHRRPAQGHQKTPPLCQDQYAPAAARGRHPSASQARGERGRAARIRHPPGEGSACAGAEGREESATALSRPVEARSRHGRNPNGVARADRARPPPPSLQTPYRVAKQ